jgi:2',3'-cyclic-nucleotide 2'-phosphodiesterase (5'-nucleotidase family)
VAVLPFGNRVVTVELTGAAIRAALERGLSLAGRRTGSLLQVSGLTLAADLGAPEGLRLLEVRTGETPLRDDRPYRVAVSSHLASGGDGYAGIAAGRRVDAGGAEPLDADALAAHVGRLSKDGPAVAPATVRITLRGVR